MTSLDVCSCVSLGEFDPPGPEGGMHKKSTTVFVRAHDLSFLLAGAATLLACAGPAAIGTGSEPVAAVVEEAGTPSASPTPPADGAGPAEPVRASEAEVEECEELFATLNGIDTNSPDLRMLEVAESRANEAKDRCRAVFLSVADSDGRRAVANAFGDLMTLRAYELKMSRLSRGGDLTSVCPDTVAILDMMHALRKRVGGVIESVELREDEAGVLQQVLTSAQAQINALEPFESRGCVNGEFHPERFITVDDLKVSPKMTAAQCRELVVAFAAFDVEQATDDQAELLAKVLEAATVPCRESLGANPPDRPTEASMEGARLAELIERGPHLLRSSAGLAAGKTDVACTAMAAFLKVTQRSIVRLTAITQRADLEADIRILAGAELELASTTLREFEATYSAACGL